MTNTMMTAKTFLSRRRVLALGALAWPAFSQAALEVGAKAPPFTAPAMLGGKPFDFSLAEALAKGPVVLYFFPAAFTSGCSSEAHAFAEAMPTFKSLGATVIGMSTDDIETLGRFSTQVCQSAFPVASDASRAVIKTYDAAISRMPSYADRVSYVIAPDAKVLYRLASSDPEQHVTNTLAAVRAWDAAQRGKRP